MELCETIVENKKILDNKTQADYIKYNIYFREFKVFERYKFVNKKY